MPDAAATQEDRLRAAFDALTPAERQLASHILRHYPVAALGSITALARAAGVSTPTVVRLVRKLGFRGYSDFQSSLRGEVEERLASPLAKHDRWAGRAPEAHVLNSFADAVLGNLQATLAQVDHAEFDAIAAALADPGRRIYLVGGRITQTLAAYLATHLSMIRAGVRLVPDGAGSWQPVILDLGPGDLLVAFDIRRYATSVLQVVEAAAAQGGEVLLVTDQWVSPAAVHARWRLSAHVEVPSAWDSSVAVLVLVETLIAAVQAAVWDSAQPRIERLEALYARTRVFRRPR